MPEEAVVRIDAAPPAKINCPRQMRILGACPLSRTTKQIKKVEDSSQLEGSKLPQCI